MESKQFYADDFYKNEEGKFYTGMYLKNNPCIKSIYTWEKIENPYETLRGKTVRCEYSQIFYPNSSILLCNAIPAVDETLYDHIENGSCWRYYDEEGNELDEEEAEEYEGEVKEQGIDIFQYYLIDYATADRLMHCTDEIIFYSEELDLYVLGVTHFGTSWDYVDMEFVY